MQAHVAAVVNGATRKASFGVTAPRTEIGLGIVILVTRKNTTEKTSQKRQRRMTDLFMMSMGKSASLNVPFPNSTESQERIRNRNSIFNPKPSQARPNREVGTATQPFARMDVQLRRLATHKTTSISTMSHE